MTKLRRVLGIVHVLRGVCRRTPRTLSVLVLVELSIYGFPLEIVTLVHVEN